jgi:hypothetical protein
MLTFDAAQFILDNTALFTTLGLVVAVVATTLPITAIVTMLALRSMK